MPTPSPASTQAPTIPDDSTPLVRRLPVWKVLLGSVVAGLGTWAVLSPLAGISLSVTTGGTRQEVGALAVALSTVVITLAAAAVAALVRRAAASPRRTFLLVSGAVLVLSLSGPIGQADTVAAGLGLSLLHLVVAAAVVPVLAACLPVRRARQ